MQRSLESRQRCWRRLRSWRYQAGCSSGSRCQHQNASELLLELNEHRCGFFFPFGRIAIAACELREEISKLSNISLHTAPSRGQDLVASANRLLRSCLLLLSRGFLGGFFGVCVLFHAAPSQTAGPARSWMCSLLDEAQLQSPPFAAEAATQALGLRPGKARGQALCLAVDMETCGAFFQVGSSVARSHLDADGSEVPRGPRWWVPSQREGLCRVCLLLSLLPRAGLCSSILAQPL